MAIRFTQDYNQEIARVVKNFNDKVRRLSQNPRYFQHADLIPDRVKVSEIKAQAINRRDLNKTLASLRRFSRRGMSDIVQTRAGEKLRYTVYEQELRRRQAKAYATKQVKRFEQTPVRIAGEQFGAKLSQGRREYREWVARQKALSKRTYDLTPKELEKFMRLVGVNQPQVQNLKKLQFKENMLKAFRKNYASTDEKEKLESVAQLIEGLSPDEFSRLYEEDAAFSALWESFYKSEMVGDKSIHAADDEEYNRYLNTVYNNRNRIFA